MSYKLLAAMLTAGFTLAGCTHPGDKSLPRPFRYDLLVSPAGSPAASERLTTSTHGTTDVDAQAGFAQLRLVSRFPEHIKFEYRCDMRGVDAIPAWAADGEPCVAEGLKGSAQYVQRFQVRLVGPAAKYYRVTYECHTASKDSLGRWYDRGHRHAGDWCGAPDRRVEEWVTRVVLFVEPTLW